MRKHCEANVVVCLQNVCKFIVLATHRSINLNNFNQNTDVRYFDIAYAVHHVSRHILLTDS